MQRMHATLAALRVMSGAEKLGGVRVAIDEYEITIGMLAAQEDFVASLERLRPLGLACAPEVVAVIPIEDTGPRSVLITRWPACPGERLLDMSERSGPASRDACDRLREDMKILAQNGLFHPYLEGDAMFHISSETRTIVVRSWECVERGWKSEIAEMFENLESNIAAWTT